MDETMPRIDWDGLQLNQIVLCSERTDLCVQSHVQIIGSSASATMCELKRVSIFCWLIFFLTNGHQQPIRTRFSDVFAALDVQVKD